jgi:hypothetical protein
MRTHLMLIALLCPVPVLADQFRVTNEVFSETSKTPIFRSLTLFNNDLVYDFAFVDPQSDEVLQATVYDFTRNRFLIVDYTADAKVEIDQEALLRFLSTMAAQVDAKATPLLKEATNPDFQITREEGRVKFSGKNLSYEVKTQKSDSKAISADYFRFADWSARLTTTLQGGMPPMARIQVNGELAKDAVLPEEVQLTISQGPIWETSKKLRSRHEFSGQLTNSDLKRIKMLQDKMAEMPLVNWDEYRAKRAASKTDGKKR